MSEWLKEADCKSAGSAYVGSNPTLPMTINSPKFNSMYRESAFIVDARYVWFDKGTRIVCMYFLNHVPFSFDPAYDVKDFIDTNDVDIAIIELADQQPRFEHKDVYRGCSYLISEQVHPCFHEVDIENPEILPDDICDTNHDIYNSL